MHILYYGDSDDTDNVWFKIRTGSSPDTIPYSSDSADGITTDSELEGKINELYQDYFDNISGANNEYDNFVDLYKNSLMYSLTTPERNGSNTKYHIERINENNASFKFIKDDAVKTGTNSYKHTVSFAFEIIIPIGYEEGIYRIKVFHDLDAKLSGDVFMNLPGLSKTVKLVRKDSGTLIKGYSKAEDAKNNGTPIV